MGLMRFLVTPADRITEEMVDQCYLVGLDRVPWRVFVRRSNGEIHLERDVSESAALHVPWHLEGHGLLVLPTATLIERDRPYHLPLEIARGKLGQVRSQAADWRSIGLDIPPLVESRIAEAIQSLSQAVVECCNTAAGVEAAYRALHLAVDAAYSLTTAFGEQALAARRRASGKLATLFGADLGVAPLDEATAGQFLQAFNAARVPMVWREIETREGKYSWEATDRQVDWCRKNGLAICAGPLIQLDERSAPDWLYVSQGNFESLMDFAAEYLEAVVNRYRGAVDVWIAAGRVNTANHLSLTEEERVRLMARAVELTRSLDALADLTLSFDQPWGEYLRQRENEIPPLHLADELLRAGLGLTGLTLEINLGLSPGGSLPRDPLDFAKLVDYWSLLNVPLMLSLSVPSGSHPDSLAGRDSPPLPGIRTSHSQQAWVGRYVPMLTAKPAVQGVFWNQLRDSEPHDFPHAGLFDVRLQPKPALRQLVAIRQGYLK
jgi:hypothetical protein